MLTISYIQSYIIAHIEIVYLLIILGVILEGEIVVIIAGILAHLDSISLYYIFIAIIFGNFIKSIIGYSLGYYLQKKHSTNRFLIQAERRINCFLPNFNKKPFLSVFLSRFLILGIYWFALIYAGYKKINLKTFIKAEILSLIIWTIVMLSIGWFFSYTALLISRDIRNFLGIILLFFIVFFILEKIISFFIKFFEFKID
jgi:membrane protein DedA with SNARE-associated domain